MNLYFRMHLLLSVFILSSCHPKKANKTPEILFTPEVRKFSSCASLNTEYNLNITRYREILGPEINYANPISPALGDAPSSPIYDTQSGGVNESDHVQANSQYIFVLRHETLEIIQRFTLTSVKTIKLPKIYFSSLYVDEDKITLLGTLDSQISRLVIYDAKNFALLKEISIKGYIKDSRIHNNQLIVITGLYPYGKVDFETISQNVFSPSCQDIYSSQLDAHTPNVTYLYKISLNDLSSPPSSIGLLGESGILYMTETSLYLVSNSFLTMPSYVRKIIWDDTSIRLTSVAQFKGNIKDRWSVQEFNDNGQKTLSLATTHTFDRTNSESAIYLFQDTNGKLVPSGQSEPFGLNEYIQSVRYVGNFAYVVTFRTTDPLFVFDLSDRKMVKKLGELKVPGFSAFLRPLSDHSLLGIGFDADPLTGQTLNLQVSLFDVSQKEQPKLKNALTFTEAYTSTTATYDAHALLYDSVTGLIAMPISERLMASSKNPYYDNYSGAQVYRYTGSDIAEIGRIDHSQWKPETYCDSNAITRMLILDNQLVSVSGLGIMAHDIDTLESIQELKFALLSPQTCYSY